ncbi:HAMP domain-containing sensor histidine kinase [Helicobacter sp. 11S03491-1]|uniref:sensor histidine kinase n=1 Tax=Helicobacter sp. 11S03491-1 TaxID=1476196 RepID=UPI000BA70B04|nr:HAMP domain-containing sensor histidine kinase [Helicobacter sp. 11S03491-1]PAF43837.1 hypothetical protein BKH45_00815 [Helicobacter sp. 11S03491-1]
MEFFNTKQFKQWGSKIIRFVVQKSYQYRIYLQKIEDYKVYLILITSVVFFVLIGANVFYQIQSFIHNLAQQNKNLIISDMKYMIESWINNKVLLLEESSNHIVKANLLKHPKEFKTFSENILKRSSFSFDSIELFLDDGKMYIDGKKFDYSTSKINPFKQEWFLKIKNSLIPSITKVDFHPYLKQEAINICTPLSIDKLKGVLCGVIKIQSLFEKIQSLHTYKAYFFITDEHLKIINHLQDEKFQNSLQNFLDSLNFSLKTNPIEINQHSITLLHLKKFDWYIGVGLDTKEILKENLKNIIWQEGIFFLCFVLLVIITNTCYEFLRRRVDLKKKEYEHILIYRSKLIEMGENLGAINHQFRQPINALSLLIQSMLLLQKDGILSEDILMQNLNLCKKSLDVLENTIEVFRKFYRYEAVIKNFNLSNCIQDVLDILGPEMNLKNIAIQTNHYQNIEVCSFETYIQQILFVLLQNAKDALIESKAKKIPCDNKILICVEEKDNLVAISITDYGMGIGEKIKANIFLKIQTSKSSNGMGFGLYFSKKIAQKKLKGDIEITSFQDPTTFKLTFSKYLNQNEGT